MKHIRNFSIIAHIDHGKSTLADRMLELTGTVESRRMRAQVLDAMELERERGITIKMTPVRMKYTRDGQAYILNLIDTPGHIDFAYEVSRALKAVEGALLLVDSTQGVQAQTLSTLSLAQEQGLTIIPVMTKIDATAARPEEVRDEIAALLNVSPGSVYAVSGKTGEGVQELLDAIVDTIAEPKTPETTEPRALIFDFEYSDHKGIIVYTRVFGGSIAKNNTLTFHASGEHFSALEVGVFTPEKKATESVGEGEIGYIVTGVKEPGIASVGDTIVKKGTTTKALSGYQQPAPVVWASIFPEGQDDFPLLRQALERLRLSDASLSFEEEASHALGRGFRCGFLGMLHLEIVTERLRREFDLELIITSPSVSYKIVDEVGERFIYTPNQFPDHGMYTQAFEPWVSGTIIARASDVGQILQLLYMHEAEVGSSHSLGVEKTQLGFRMPLRELYRNFFDELKSVSSGFASLSYEPAGLAEAHVARLDVLIAGEVVPALSRVVSEFRFEEEAQEIVERLHNLLPKQQFAAKIQASGKGRIVASRTLKAVRKDVTSGLYGGDITRKRKVLERQKRGKKRLKEHGRVHIPHDTFIKIMRPKE